MDLMAGTESRPQVFSLSPLQDYFLLPIVMPSEAKHLVIVWLVSVVSLTASVAAALIRT